MKNIKLNWQLIWIIIFICCVIVMAWVITHYPSLYNDLIGSTEPNGTLKIDAWFYFLSGAGTVALAFIAWIRIGDIYKQNEGDFLLHIDARWGSPESIKARAIIHELYLQVQNDDSLLIGLSLTDRDSAIQENIGKKIIELRGLDYKAEEFIYLLNFLDFMETIGYIENKGYITHQGLDALCGEALIFNYKIFQEYIEIKRLRHDDPGFYKNFERLFNKLNAEKQCKKLESQT